MTPPRVLLGISGGIAAYKAAYLASRLVQDGCQVQAVLSPAARRFVGEATLAALTGRAVASRLFDRRFPLGAHVELAEAQLLCVAPATADFLAKAAHGLADDLLSTLYLAFTGPVVMAPAMNPQMWRQPAVQRNVAHLAQDGVILVGPEEGWVSCRQQGMGRMADPDKILQVIYEQLAGGTTQPASGL
ncbi:MAG: phosphopantothenoylcysteine decarboxylase [Pirellulaceae bacterium]|nr:MAG: phosphopantothenoylcysteine decarboxylase [Pirellulaceae bacterium]